MTGVLRRGGSLVSIRAMDGVRATDEFRATDGDAFRVQGELNSTSPWKGEVGRVAAGRGSRFARTTAMTSNSRHLINRRPDGLCGLRPPPGELTLANLPLSGGGDGGGSSAIVFGEVDR